MKNDEDADKNVAKKTPPDVPGHVIESFARCLLPGIREYFDSGEGQKEFEKWTQKKLGRNQSNG